LVELDISLDTMFTGDIYFFADELSLDSNIFHRVFHQI